ncbi:MAG: pyruvate ferredoxin oxidoreductase [Tepidanaerobacteraceae bacterium]|jgi:pyruvate ferredoxin oxidoreductase alpha subunit|nr:pyruvate ferredoxin oxidoreductase [Tepidanaerobacteraceae bacterium]
MTYKMLDGNGAAVEAMKLARVKVVSAYPITPQSSIAEKLSELVAKGELDAEYIRVESEHTAMSAAAAAQLTGVRAATATSSVGLALMSEVVGLAAGCRVPIVMPVVNRALVAPWSLWCDHSDAMSVRDSGWLQFYCQNVQDVLDLMIMAYKIAEHEKVLLPAMVCLDGFFLSHSMQKVEVYDQKLVDQFIGEYIPKNTYLNTEDPMFICDLTPPEDFTELKYQQKVAMDNAVDVIAEVQDEFYRIFGRKSSIIEEYMTEDADAVLVALGSMSGTAKHVANEMRKRGLRVGVLKIVVYRPFPFKQIREALKAKKVVGVFDRSAGLGAQGGPVWTEVCAALRGLDIDIRGYVGGLGGRDVPETTIEKIFNELLDIYKGKRILHTNWIDVKDNAMEIREVLKVV